MTVATDVVGELVTEQQKVVAEIRELDLLVESTQTEVNRLKAREDQTKTRVEEVRASPGTFQREEIFSATDEHASAISRRMTMEGQLGALQGKRKLLDRVQTLLTHAQNYVRESASAAAPMSSDAPVIDESKLLQAVVDTQEAERKRIARQVHDGPAQAMANVVLQSEISERLFEVDPQRSRTELAALRSMVNKTLQELRGFIFELRPMILDDLGLVPTMRRYVQTLIDKHGIRIDFSSPPHPGLAGRADREGRGQGPRARHGLEGPAARHPAADRRQGPPARRRASVRPAPQRTPRAAQGRLHA